LHLVGYFHIYITMHEFMNIKFKIEGFTFTARRHMPQDFISFACQQTLLVLFQSQFMQHKPSFNVNKGVDKTILQNDGAELHIHIVHNKVHNTGDHFAACESYETRARNWCGLR